MRYFVEVTATQALELEKQEYATVAQAASGGAAHPQWYGENSEWVLLRSNELRKLTGPTEAVTIDR